MKTLPLCPGAAPPRPAGRARPGAACEPRAAL